MEFGYRYDTETGFYYLNSRYYNPEWGRFINADGIATVTGELLSSNMFAYCKNNAINMTDESGFRPVFNNEEQEDAYQQWLGEQQEELEEQNATDRMRGSDSIRGEQKQWKYAKGKRGTKERDDASEESHEAKKKQGKPNDKNVSTKRIIDNDFYDFDISPGTRIVLGVGGLLVIGGTIVEDFVTGGAGTADDGVTLSCGFGMVVKAFS